jgi:hypothetical protein
VESGKADIADMNNTPHVPLRQIAEELSSPRNLSRNGNFFFPPQKRILREIVLFPDFSEVRRKGRWRHGAAFDRVQAAWRESGFVPFVFEKCFFFPSHKPSLARRKTGGNGEGNAQKITDQFMGWIIRWLIR